ncbi:MAG: ABC transporter ATP-binding protein [Lachnospiraceae bacterium]|nr:ABC transporter ATP-binding protein [Lachnospiraceae bacterium]
MSNNILSLDSITLKYGDKVAIKDLSLSLTDGVYGLLGPNGSGKSSLMNMIATILTPNKGHITFNDYDINTSKKEYLKVLGYMPQQQKVYDNFTLKYFMEYMCSLKGISRKDTKFEVEDTLRYVGLYDRRFDTIGSFSGGMKQRALIAQAVLGDPKIILLDEPTAGLDPKERVRVRNLISQIASDKIVLIATHIVSDIECIAKEIIVINNGTIMYKDTISNILGNIDGLVYEALVSKKDTDFLKTEVKIVNMSHGENDNMIVRFIDENKKYADYATKVWPNLEDLYIHLFGEL